MTSPLDLSPTRRGLLTTGMLAAAGLAISACGGGGTTRRGGTQSSVLRIGMTVPPANLDPTRAGMGDIYADLAYGSLIYRAPNGDYQPRLAESWQYLGTGNRAFELKLRAGLTFSDGSPLNAAAVKASIEYYRTAPASQAAPFLAPITSIDLVDDRTVHLALSQPQPLMPAVFTQDYLAGNVINPAAVKQPGQLATQTFGAGPYMLAPSETAAGDHYTYVTNPKYHNPGEVHFKRVVIRILPNENTALAALKTGQVDAVSGTYASAAAAKAAGLGVAYYPAIAVGLGLLDRAGKLSKPLADQRVRQALNYAVDRDKVAKALLGEYGAPTDQLAAPGQPGHNDDTFYSYDPAKARALLTEAGYPDGFTLDVGVAADPSGLNLVQAIADQLGAVGVKLKLATVNANEWQSAMAKRPASYLGWGITDPYVTARGLWLPGTIANPFNSADPTLQTLDQQAAAADEATRATLNKQIIQRVRELAWFLPVCFTPVFFFYRNTISGVSGGDNELIASPDAWRPAA